MWERWCQAWWWMVVAFPRGLAWLMAQLPPRLVVAAVVLGYGISLIVWAMTQ